MPQHAQRAVAIRFEESLLHRAVLAARALVTYQLAVFEVRKKRGHPSGGRRRRRWRRRRRFLDAYELHAAVIAPGIAAIENFNLAPCSCLPVRATLRARGRRAW
jgi:hypothetical protein